MPYNLTGTVVYEPRPGRGKMEFGYELVRLWEHPAEELRAGPLGAAGKASRGNGPRRGPGGNYSAARPAPTCLIL
jgi:hypothetical protein